WNRRAPETAEPDFRLRPGVAGPPLDELADMTEEAFGARFNGTPVRRAGLEGMRRNARAVLRNRGNS
ncbi:MAG TPA: tRNA epoxyqueuosine(34) reductase QueG, partial [Candidatus Hydrogenedentes bacterium]|nr:tRNA epoxyqueuosine(34) reductase QueG [Candidatus Hydrogenedentota bacterium]